jgi:hypothetical protein
MQGFTRKSCISEVDFRLSKPSPSTGVCPSGACLRNFEKNAMPSIPGDIQKRNAARHAFGESRITARESDTGCAARSRA